MFLIDRLVCWIFPKELSIPLGFHRSVVSLIGIQLVAYFAIVIRNGTIAAMLSLEFLGQLAVMFSYAKLVSLVFGMGWPQLLLRDVASNRDHQMMQKMLLSRSLFVTLGSLGATTVIGYGLCQLLGWPVSPLLWMACLMAAMTICVSLFGAVMEGLGHVLTSRILTGVGRPLIVIIAVALMSVLGTNALMTGYFLAQGAYVAAFVIVAIWLGARMSLGAEISPVHHRGRFSVENLQVLAISGFNVLILTADVLVLQIYEPMATVGSYSIVVTLMSLVGIGMGAVNSLFLPHYGHALRKNDWPAASAMFATSRRISSLWSVCAVVVLVMTVFAAGPVLGIDEAFHAAPAIILFLGLGHVVNAMTGPNTNSLFVEGKTRYIALSLGAAALLNIIGNFLLIPMYGVLGAAISTGFSVSFIHLVQFRYAKQTSQIHVRR